LNEVGKSYLKMYEYFDFILLLVKMNVRFAEWFQANQLSIKLIHFMMNKDSNLS